MARRPVRFLPYHLKHKGAGQHRSGPARDAGGLTVRGVVTAVHESGDPTARGKSLDEQVAAVGITCDVLVYEHPYRTVLYNIPILVQSGGLNDHTVWKPRPSTVDLVTGSVVISPEGGPTNLTSKAQNLDGDHVLLMFMGNDLNQPVIVGQLPHPRNLRAQLFVDPVKSKFKRYLQGTSFAVGEDGNITVDMSLASTGSITPGTGIEIPTAGPLPASGNMTIVAFTGNIDTGAKVRVIDSLLSAPEAVILGETWLADFDAHLLDLGVYIAAVAAAADETSTGLIALGQLGAANANIGLLGLGYTTFNTSLLAYQAFIGLAQTIGLPYLSSHLEVD